MYLSADHKCAIRQGFAVSLLLTPLFFSEFLVKFLGSNEKEIGVKGLYRGGTPGRPRGGDRPPLSPGGGDRLPLRACGRGTPGRTWVGRQAPLHPHAPG